MADIIKLLPDSVANQIAAGEVIQRPASVIKELVENAADAGATEICIYIKDAGRTLIQVVDNGCGMSETDARMAFERHATSKIRRADDLFTLRSMGFRGEALPSICAISQLELRTKSASSSVGTRLLIEGSEVTLQEPDACDKGTSIAVRNLFYNVPARRKFLKSDNVELANIMREFERLALVNNNIRMRLDTGSKVVDLPAASFRQRIEGLWKNNLKAELVPVEIDTSLVKISGYISRPEYARRRNPLQFLIVNGRNMRHPYFHKAILNCYESLIASDTQPCYFIKFEVDPASIDVNIHPTKNEIKFEYESEIWKLLSTAIKGALGMFSAVPSIDFESDVVPVEPLTPGEKAKAPDTEFMEHYNPFEVASSFSGGKNIGRSASFNPFQKNGKRGETEQQGYSRHSHVSANWEDLYNSFLTGAAAKGEQVSQPAPDLFTAPHVSSDGIGIKEGMVAENCGETTPGTGPLCMQVGLKYLVTTTRDGLIIIDQHRAHTKILYERYLRDSRREHITQRILFPETILLDPDQEAILMGIMDELEALGFEMEKGEGDEWKILSVPPSEKGIGEPRDVIMRIIESITEDNSNYGRDAAPARSMLERTALLLARSTAITGGRRLTQEEIEQLTGELFRLPDPALTPDGHRIYTRLDLSRLAQLLP